MKRRWLPLNAEHRVTWWWNFIVAYLIPRRIYKWWTRNIWLSHRKHTKEN